LKRVGHVASLLQCRVAIQVHGAFRCLPVAR
jgi:hypothetical protein